MPFPNLATQFKPGQSGNPEGMKPGTVHLQTRIRRMLEEGHGLPQAVKDTIRNAVGEDKTALEAGLIVGLLQWLQGDKDWAKLLIEMGYGKAVAPHEISGPGGAALTVVLQDYTSKADKPAKD